MIWKWNKTGVDHLHVHANGGGYVIFTASHVAATDYFYKKGQFGNSQSAGETDM
ncbi:MAG: hypothetical protein ABFD57_02495 [Smithella sp.]